MRIVTQHWSSSTYTITRRTTKVARRSAASVHAREGSLDTGQRHTHSGVEIDNFATRQVVSSDFDDVSHELTYALEQMGAATIPPTAANSRAPTPTKRSPDPTPVPVAVPPTRSSPTAASASMSTLEPQMEPRTPRHRPRSAAILWEGLAPVGNSMRLPTQRRSQSPHSPASSSSPRRFVGNGVRSDYLSPSSHGKQLRPGGGGKPARPTSAFSAQRREVPVLLLRPGSPNLNHSHSFSSSSSISPIGVGPISPSFSPSPYRGPDSILRACPSADAMLRARPLLQLVQNIEQQAGVAARWSSPSASLPLRV